MIRENTAYKKRVKALIVEGGAMRGVFSTGVLDLFLEKNFNPFDIYYGVSAGACNLASYLAKMDRRNINIYTDYSLRPDFISIRKFFGGGHFMDLDWLWNITINETRLNLKTIFSSGRKFIVGLTDLLNGKPVYTETDESNLEEILKATSALPFLYRGDLRFRDIPVADGGLSDPIPVEEAIKRGADNIMVIRSRPKSYEKKNSVFMKYLFHHFSRFPELEKLIESRIDKYNSSLEILRNPPENICITEVCPPQRFPVARLTRSRSHLYKGYEIGRQIGEPAIERWFSNGV
ncbi:MAG: patatin family protein [Desulfobacteraceae bacterium]